MRNLVIYTFLIGVIFFIMCDTPIPNSQTYQYRQIHFISRETGKGSFFLACVPQTSEPPTPVLYLLNGAGADAFSWTTGADLQEAADQFDMIIVSLASGQYPYRDVPGDSSQSYESYVLEIVKIVDDNYDTGKTRNLRGIGGISLGGIGAIYIASRHSGKFISVTSLSGTHDIDYMPSLNGLENLNLRIDVGYGDENISNFRYFNQLLIENNIEHEYNEYPGGHNWAFWSLYYKEQIEFHSKIFEKYR